MSSPKNNAQVFPVSVPETTPNSVSRSLDASAFGLCSLDQHELEGLDMLLERGKTLDLLSTEVELVHKVMRMNNDKKKIGQKFSGYSKHVKSRWLSDEDGEQWANCFFSVHAPAEIVLSKVFFDLKDIAVGIGYHTDASEEHRVLDITSREILETNNSDKINTFVKMDHYQDPITSKTFRTISKVVFFELTDSSFILLLVPISAILTKKPGYSGNVGKLKGTTVILISGNSAGKSCKVSIYNRVLDEKSGNFGRFEKLRSKEILKQYSLIRLFYQKKRLAFNLDDARAAGEGLARAYERESFFTPSIEVVHRHFLTYNTLADLGKLEWIHDLMAQILCNRLRLVKHTDVEFSSVTSKDAQHIGMALPASLATNSMVVAGVEEWIQRFPALLTLEQEVDWFKPMVLAVAQQLILKASWGLKARVVFGAAISLFDAISDILVIRYFLANGQTGFATANIVMLSVTLFLSFFVSILNTMGTRGWKKNLAYEALFTFTFLKPALDAYRVSSGAEQKEGQVMPPLSELMYTKAIEMVSEAIPSACVQTFALLISKDKPFIMVLSIFLSASTIGYSTSLISYDKDIEPQGRRTQPWIYGYIEVSPLKRGMAFSSMCSVSALQVFMKAIMFSLLGVAGNTMLLTYIGAEIGLYLCWKGFRGDFRYFIPIENNAISLILSFFVRIVEMMLFDFSAMVHLRHPYQLGGAAWAFFLIWSQISVYLAVPIYAGSDYYLNPNEEGKLTPSQLYTILASINALWLISAVAFCLSIKRSFIPTFYSLTNGPGNCKKMFKNGATGSEKLQVLTDHSAYRRGFEEDLKEYLLENWPKWMEERPDWFRPAIIISQMPKHYTAELDLEEAHNRGPSTPISGSGSGLSESGLRATFKSSKIGGPSLMNRPSGYSLKMPPEANSLALIQVTKRSGRDPTLVQNQGESNDEIV